MPQPGSRRARFATVALLLVFAVLLIWGWPFVRHVPAVIALLRADMPSPLPVPVEGVRPRQIADTWGGPRSGGRRHEGSDIFAKCGTPVRSATKGIVLRVGDNKLGGNTVAVFGPGGYVHYYAHLRTYADARRGDWVEAGRVIGYVGDTGNAKGTPCHLHYGIYATGGAVNPYPFFFGGN